MLDKVEGIVLRNIKYSDNSLIIHLYTREYGRISCMVKRARSKKSGFAPSLFQPFNIIQTEIYFKEHKEIHNIKEVQLINSFTDLTNSPGKLAIRMFLTEILNKCIRYQHTDEELYNFLLTSINRFAKEDKSSANFHLYFLIELTRFLGFYPVNNHSVNTPVFDLLNAQFINDMMGSQTLSSEISLILHQFLSLETGNWWDIKLSVTQRKLIIESLLNYYSIHSGLNMDIKSLEVFTEVFN